MDMSGAEFLDTDTIVLVSNTLGNMEQPSFVVSRAGAIIGHDVESADINLPSDPTLIGVHGKVVYKERNPNEYKSQKERPSANTVLQDEEESNINENHEEGKTIGRGRDADVCIEDRELSRCHCKIEYMPEYACFCLRDMGSRNGTYMQLSGLYGSERELCLGDHILVGRTGFRIDRFEVGKSECIGMRRVMEDRTIVVPTLGVPGLYGKMLTPQSFYGVYDGHGGDEASIFLQKHLHNELRKRLTAKATRLGFAVDNILRGELFSTDEENTMDTRIGLFDLYMKQAFMEAFCETDEKFLKTARPESGSTATTALILGNRIYSANVGDSRTILSRGGKLVMASYDHTPQREDEEARIKHAGGFIAGSRVMGELAVSRSFGDMKFKRQIHSRNGTWNVKLVTCTPEFQALPLTPDDDFVVLACDGLFDVFSNQEVLDAVREQMDKYGSTDLACAEITKQAIEQRGTRDNVSMLLVLLKPWERKE